MLNIFFETGNVTQRAELRIALRVIEIRNRRFRPYLAFLGTPDTSIRDRKTQQRSRSGGVLAPAQQRSAVRQGALRGALFARTGLSGVKAKNNEQAL